MLDDVIVLPRAAMRNDDRVLVVGAEDRLHRKAVERVRIDRDDVLIRADFAPDERIVVSPLQVVVEGMQVHPMSPEDEEPSEPVLAETTP